MSDQQAKKLLEEAADIRRRFASETTSELRAQLTARYYQIEAELKLIRANTAPVVHQVQSIEPHNRLSGILGETSEFFGIRIGTPVEQLGSNIVQLGDGVIGVRSVPKPHSLFDHYMVLTSRERRVTGVVAFKPIDQVNQYGSELRSQFQTVMLQLKRKYGEPCVIEDELDDGSAWTSAEHWMIGLLENERRLVAKWSKGANIPADIKSIRLYASADSAQEGKLVLRYESIEYEFVVSEECADDDVL